MAKTIITEGKDLTDHSNRVVYTRTCPECGCKFTYTYDDIVDSNWRGGYVAVICPNPTCNYPVAHIVGGSGQDNNHPVKEDPA